ncbi:MAG: glycosyltransferase [Bacillota bacterium]
MSIVWILGGIFFWSKYERKPEHITITVEKCPPITILVPCHNEESTIDLTCGNLKALNYLDYHVIFIDDASTDHTVQVLRHSIADTAYFHLLRIEQNQGKAGALNTALSIVQTPFVLILDADTIIDKDALKWFIHSFTLNTNIAAVTGNPLPLNRTNFLSKFQTSEFMSIIGLIKRCQCYLGSLYTVSGCATMYKTSALKSVGGFSRLTATEDIDITWKLQRKLFDIWFQPKAVAYIQVPTKFKEYLRQRKRWATGGWHLLRAHKDVFKNRTLMKLWPVFFEAVLAYVWSFCFVASVIVNLYFKVYFGYNLIYLFSWTASIVSILCILQITIAIYMNSTYDKNLKDCFFWIPWYPILFFSVGAVLVVFTSLKGMFGSLENSGKWRSPKREVTNILG